VNELLQRRAEAAVYSGNPSLHAIQSAMHILKIGFSPAYVATGMSQVPVLGHPELAKYVGYMKSAKFIAAATPRAIRILRTLEFPTVTPRESLMKAAGDIPAKDIETVIQADNRGAISTASFTHEQREIEEGITTAKQIHAWGNVLGSSVEILPRLIMALATKDAYDANPKAFGKMRDSEAIDSVVNRSQYEYGAGASSRMLGNRGLFGSFTPINMSFMTFHSKMVAKLYTEMHDLFGKARLGESPEAVATRRRQAGTFLASHLIATTAIAGTLGLPFASSFASVYDKLANTLTGKDDIDVEAAYRTWLASVFGKEAGEAVAKGLPRAALGIDLAHLGDQNLAPFRSVIGLLTSKRKFEDAAEDFLHQWSGSAFNEAVETVLGGRDLFNGDYMLGAQRLLPDGFKGLADAYYLSEHGYVDKQGRALPISAGAMNVLKAAIGLTPANEAQYKDAEEIASGLLAQRQYRLQNIGAHLSRGVLMHDPAELQIWLGEAAKYAVDHPGLGNPLFSLGRNIQRNVQQQAIAGATGAPIGIRPQDFDLRNSIGFLGGLQ
jgi:hypothetical protein